MTQQATIHGHVTYTPGDGAPLTIPKGSVELEPSKDSTTLSWTADNEAAGSAAIPNDQFNQYVREGKIKLKS
jgi:carbon monoxide dehydrogenase subunit G